MTTNNEILALHGTKGPCPVCGAPGTFDTKDDMINFTDSIWTNEITGEWECYDCWLK